tara:strand:- start:1304 stop:1510 length:207 start_codon:yes stop_codon:yes gene_type:complete
MSDLKSKNNVLIQNIKTDINIMKQDIFTIKNDMKCIRDLLDIKIQEEEVVIKVKKKEIVETESTGWFF